MYATPEDAEHTFYDAFARGDLDTMRSVWFDDDSIVCIHPGADTLRGRAAVHASWEQILRSPSSIRHQVQWRSQGPLIAVHIGHEWVPTGAGQTAVLVATNVFQITPEGWRMLLHQGARLDPQATAPGAAPIH